MSMPVAEVGSYKRLTSTGAVCAGPCQLLGFYVAATTAGTVVLTDGSTAMSGTITPAIGFHRFPSTVGTSLTATIAGTALDVTFFYASGN
ncbi:MAG: hypothetical protein JW395_3641 [Nitrospira sp.]|nr:hypothetical protein [Nitrospira sp.]